MISSVNNQSLKRSFSCECTNFSFVSGDTASLEFLWPGPAPRAGQFFLIKPNRTGVFLARPISVAGWKPRRHHVVSREERPIGEEGILRFLVSRRGRGSREITDMRPGEEAELSGPLGNFWPWAEIPRGPIALIGGGAGISPLLALAPELGKRAFDFYAGFRTGTFGMEKIKPRSFIISTEDGSHGVKGRITDYFSATGYCGVFACGPEPMLKTLGDICIAKEVPCFVSVEKHMACGVGACLGCKVKTTRGYLRCCTDGPVFNVEELCFED
jgi:NAD(P)H-flavin reductase